MIQYPFIIEAGTSAETFIAELEQNVADYRNIDLQVTFITEYSSSKILRDIIFFLLEKNTIHIPWKGRFVLIADELINNSIEHGSRL